VQLFLIELKFNTPSSDLLNDQINSNPIIIQQSEFPVFSIKVNQKTAEEFGVYINIYIKG